MNELKLKGAILPVRVLTKQGQRLLFGLNTDMQSGLKMFRHAIYEKVSFSPGRWSLDLYLVTHAVFHGYVLTNVPIDFHERQREVSREQLPTEMVFSLCALLQSDLFRSDCFKDT